MATWIPMYGLGCLADPIPQLVFHDTFTDTNGVLLENHTPDIGVGWVESYEDNGHVEIQSNRMEPSASTTVSEWIAGRHNPDAMIEADLLVVDNLNGAAITFRGLTNSDRADNWQFGLGVNFAYVQRRENDVNVISNTNFATGTNTGILRAMRVELAGDLILLFTDNVLMFTITNDTHLLGHYHGAKVYGAGVYIDNFKITSVEPS